MSGKDAIHSFLDHVNGQKLTPVVTLLLGGAVVGSMSNVYPLYVAAGAAFLGGIIACCIYIPDQVWRFVCAVGWCGVMALFWFLYFSPTIHENEKQAKQLADAIANISGGDSYVEVVPEGHATISYAIFNVGHSILSNVSITVVSFGIPTSELYTVDVGTLAPSDVPVFMRFVSLPLIPEKSPYELFINAPNGTTIEVIQFRKGPCGSWSTRYSIQPPMQLNKPSRPIKGFTEWADEKC
jgi:hypothetical protein